MPPIFLWFFYFFKLCNRPDIACDISCTFYFCAIQTCTITPGKSVAKQRYALTVLKPCLSELSCIINPNRRFVVSQTATPSGWNEGGEISGAKQKQAQAFYRLIGPNAVFSCLLSSPPTPHPPPPPLRPTGFQFCGVMEQFPRLSVLCVQYVCPGRARAEKSASKCVRKSTNKPSI
jgi:hypothetical protein